MGCKGSCCAVFALSRALDHCKSGCVTDGDMIAFMARPLAYEQAVQRAARFGAYEGRTPSNDKAHYRCIYWDEHTRLCGAYEHRPQMCRAYPGYSTGNRCDHGCDCTDAAYGIDPLAHYSMVCGNLTIFQFPG